MTTAKWRVPEWVLNTAVGSLICLSAWALKEHTSILKWQAESEIRLVQLMSLPNKIQQIEIHTTMIDSELRSNSKQMDQINILLDKLVSKVDIIKTDVAAIRVNQ
jgi:hypothetical protein